VVAKVKERLAVNKQRSHRFHVERFNLKKLNEAEGKEKYCVEVSNRFVASEDLNAEVEINSAWDTIRENIKISAKQSLGYFEFKKPWFDEGYSKLLDQRKEAKLHRLQDPSEINGDNPNNNLRVFESGVLRRIVGPKRDEVTVEWRKLRNEELCDLYSSPSIIRIEED
jgi:hypothetical protein